MIKEMKMTEQARRLIDWIDHLKELEMGGSYIDTIRGRTLDYIQDTEDYTHNLRQENNLLWGFLNRLIKIWDTYTRPQSTTLDTYNMCMLDSNLEGLVF
jgi:hypothetical protein